MSEGNVKIKQLKYKSGDLIAPYTPAHTYVGLKRLYHIITTNNGIQIKEYEII